MQNADLTRRTYEVAKRLCSSQLAEKKTVLRYQSSTYQMAALALFSTQVYFRSGLSMSVIVNNEMVFLFFTPGLLWPSIAGEG